MTATLIIVALGLVSLTIVVLVGGRRIFFPAITDISKMIAVDIEAFQNLLDKEDNVYLRSKLTWYEYHRFEHERSLVLAEYVRCIAYNSGLLIAASHNVEVPLSPENLRQQNAEMLRLAVETRALCLSALTRLYIKACFPWISSSLDEVCAKYIAAMGVCPNLSSAYRARE
jgi:hypothetical protein